MARLVASIVGLLGLTVALYLALFHHAPLPLPAGTMDSAGLGEVSKVALLFGVAIALASLLLLVTAHTTRRPARRSTAS